jgi:hypothetical protein
MRKQDRIANQQQNQRQQPNVQPPRPQKEQLKGSAAGSPPQSARPQRQPGKLPIPD